jgi:SAM-dependent methyltransferase
MIIHKLISRALYKGDDTEFYTIQAKDSIQWLQQKEVQVGTKTTVLDLGCGKGIFGLELRKRGCRVTFADQENCLMPEIEYAVFKKIDIDNDDLTLLGRFDIIVCSNVLEHLAHPARLISAAKKLLTSDGSFYLSWTNWLSPWGGHEFSPFHYLGSKRGHIIFDKVTHRKRKHTPYVNLFPTSIGHILQLLEKEPCLRIRASTARYYPEFSFILTLPIVREFLSWNCALLLARTNHRDSRIE